MNVQDMAQEIIDIVHAAFNPTRQMVATDKIKDAGLDSLDMIECVLILEERWPDAKLDEYHPGLDVTFAELAVEVHKRVTGQM